MDMIKGFLQDKPLFLCAVAGATVVSIYMIWKYSDIEVAAKGFSLNAKKASEPRETVENVGNEKIKKGNQTGNNSKVTKTIKLKPGKSYKNFANKNTISGDSTNCTTEEVIIVGY